MPSSEPAPSSAGNPPLSDYAVALLDELESLAKTEEAAPADRLCHPPEAVSTARLAAWAACAPRETAEVAGGGDGGGNAQNGGESAEGSEFLQSLKSKLVKSLEK